MGVSDHRRNRGKFDGSDYVLCSNGFYHAIYMYDDWIQIVFVVVKYVIGYMNILHALWINKIKINFQINELKKNKKLRRNNTHGIN